LKTKIPPRWLRAALLCTLAAGAACRAADAPRSAASITDFRIEDPALMKERAAQLDAAEAALVRGDTEAALAGFERAAGMLHAPDTEMGLVRSQMQAGQYRRALAFAAHTAGAHLEAPAASALYAWLLRIGGQEAYARQLLDAAIKRSPGNDVLGATQRAFNTASSLASGALLERPHRMAPHPLAHAGSSPVAPLARPLASAVLLGDGRFALASAGDLKAARRLWVRSGMGQTTAAAIDRTFADSGLVLLALERPLPAAAQLAVAPRDPFAGSPGFVVDFAAGTDATPQWPMLHAGFFAGGAAAGAAGAARALGIATSTGSSGAAVFDAGGRWVGIALPPAADSPAPRWLPLSQLRGWLGDLLQSPLASESAAPTRIGADEAYERSLPVVLQVLVEP
jgi:tetratricopeptide (TPR) repeat protein